MDTMQAYAMAQANAGKENKVFDWNKAAKLIKEKNATTASAGLAGDWGYTGGEIFAYGKPIDEEDTYVFLSSNWATPEIVIDGEIMECFKLVSETDNWDAATYWPESALSILNAE